MFQLNTFHFWLFSKEKIILFTKHLRIQPRSYNKNKRSFSINPLVPHSSRIRKNLFFCMNRYYSIPIPSRYLPRKIPNWIPNWRVSVSLSMRLCTLRIGIHFLKDPGFRALVGLRDPFDDLCCVEGISVWSDRLRKARGSNGTGESIQKRQFFSIIFYSISIS